MSRQQVIGPIPTVNSRLLIPDQRHQSRSSTQVERLSRYRDASDGDCQRWPRLRGSVSPMNDHARCRWRVWHRSLERQAARLSRPDPQREHRSAHGSLRCPSGHGPLRRGRAASASAGTWKLIGALEPRHRTDERLGVEVRDVAAAYEGLDFRIDRISIGSSVRTVQPANEGLPFTAEAHAGRCCHDRL
jgi:hypothetical protein